MCGECDQRDRLDNLEYEVMRFAEAHGFERDITWERGGMYGFVRVHGWNPRSHCWAFMDLKPEHVSATSRAALP